MQQRSNEEILVELGTRLRQERMNQDLTQAALASRAGLHQPMISRIERGHDFTMETLLAVLRALNRLDNLNAFIPTPPVSPLDLARRRGADRQRVRTTKDAQPEPTWRWGDEDQDASAAQGSAKPGSATANAERRADS